MVSPMGTRLIDHGETVVHDMRGQPSHRLHELSVPWGSTPPEGYSWLYGWLDREGFHWSLHTKCVPLKEGDA